MLNISPVSVNKHIDKSQYKAFAKLNERTHSNLLPRILVTFFFIFLASLFLPWTQNIRSNGKVSTLNPYDRPQNIQAQIGGRISKWHVKEGDVVQIGDTILLLSEAKSEYLDPQLINNTKEQENAKLKSAEAYQSKSNFLKQQLKSINELQTSKLEQLDIKQRQFDLEISSVTQDLIAAQTYELNASNQLRRMEEMYNKGIKSLTDLETKRLSNREAEAKVNSLKNKLEKLKNEKTNIVQEISITIADNEQKISKTEADIRSADSYRFNLLGESNKLKSKTSELEQRQNAFVITSPINGRITKVLKNGIGEFVKSQDDIATIVPTEFRKSVELYIAPMDMPLMQIGKEVRLQFDGWPAIVFSGWPNNSFGTFSGEVYAIDNDISENGKYRIIVTEKDPEKPWPNLIRIGSGARGLLLLSDVKVGYEVWRKLNGFPPDFYDPEGLKKVKNKAPLKKVK